MSDHIGVPFHQCTGVSSRTDEPIAKRYPDICVGNPTGRTRRKGSKRKRPSPPSKRLTVEHLLSVVERLLACSYSVRSCSGRSLETPRHSTRGTKAQRLALTKEELRDMRTGAALERLWQETRHAARRLIRSPAFALATVLTLALTIGATAALFAVV